MAQYVDAHTHTHHSADSAAPMRDMIEAAIARGLCGICFTDHMDLDYPGEENFDLDIPAYRREWMELKRIYARSHPAFAIRFGMELGLQEHLAERHYRLTAAYDFDFIIASTHVVDGMDPYYPVYFERAGGEAGGFRRYFESILRNIRLFDDFDVYGHLDYVVRYAPGKDACYSYERYAQVIDEILRLLIEKGKGIELNTAGIRKGMREMNPCAAVVERYRALGGEIITLGSDAHTPADVAADFTQAVEVLKNAGFDYYTVFENRKPTFVKL